MKYILITFALVISTTNCTNVDKVQDEGNAPSFYKAIAVINPINDSNVSGIAYFQQTENGVHVKAEVYGLTGEKHGSHRREAWFSHPYIRRLYCD